MHKIDLSLSTVNLLYSRNTMALSNISISASEAPCKQAATVRSARARTCGSCWLHDGRGGRGVSLDFRVEGVVTREVAFDDAGELGADFFGARPGSIMTTSMAS